MKKERGQREMNKTFRKLSILTFATAIALPLVNIPIPIAAEEFNVKAVDENGYNVLGSVLSATADGNRINLTISTGEEIRFTFLENNVFRMYMAPIGETFKEYPSPNSAEHTATITAKTDAQYEAEYKVKPTVKTENGKITIATSKVLIEIDEATSMMKAMKADGTVIWEESAPLKYKSGSTVQTLKTNENEYFYGGGTQNGRFSHKGKTIQIVNTNNWVDKGVASPNPFYWSTDGYGVVRNTWKPGSYAFGSEDAGTITTTHNEKRFDAYYFIDDTPVEILGDYYELTGSPVELPEYASYLGHLNCYNRDYWKEVAEGTNGAIKLGSKWYTESQSDNGGVKETLLGDANTTAQQVIEDHKENDMPLGWFLPNDGYGCGYGQSTSQAGDIENLKKFSDYAISNGVQTGLWTQSNLWPADPSNPKKGERDIYKEVEAGVHSVKTDVAWVGSGYSMALNGISVAYDAITSKSGMKANIVSLDGWAGSQRYAGIWSGDQSGGQWEYIRFHIPTYIGTSLSGQPNIGSDMDGIFGGKNKIINTRDFQWKAFTTYMLDMDGWGSNQKTPWALGEDATSINRSYLKLKAELMPYLNTMSHEATAKDGLPMLRAMFLEESNPYTLGSATQYQYMWGDNFLVAPIYQNTQADSEGNDIRDEIYLPSTSDIWTDYFTGKQYRGGQVLNNFDAPIWKLPVFVKNGSIIPMYPENNNPEAISETNTDGLDRSQRVIEFYPHGETSFNIYEDDGKTLGGASSNTEVTSNVENNVAKLHVSKTIGNYTGMVKERSNKFIVNVSQEPTKVTGKVKGDTVNFTKVTTQEEFDAADGNVYFYNDAPKIFISDYASAGSKYETTDQTTTPKVYIKSSDKVDITSNEFEVSVHGYVNEQDLGIDTLNESMEIPGGLNVTDKNDSEISLVWDEVAEATTYDIEADGIVYRNLLTPNYKHVGLIFSTTHEYRVRSVNASGYSNWGEIVSAETEDNPYRNVPNVTATWDYDVYNSEKVENAFDRDIRTTFHSKSAVTPEQMVVMDLGAAYQMDKLTYQPRMDNKGNGTVYKMDVYGSLDGLTYTKVWDGNANPEWTYDKANMDVEDIKTIDLTGLKIRYLKLSALSSAGGYFGASEITPYKVDGTDAWVVGDVNNSGSVDDNDLVFYENYVGLKPVDQDWEYSTLGNIDNNDIIDAYDISFVARMLGEKITSAKVGTSGKIQIVPSKTDIKAGDFVTLDIYGLGLENVNAFSVEIPVDGEQFEVTNFGSPSSNTVFMRNFSKTRFHNDGSVDNYICFTNVGKQDLINGTGSLAKVTIKATKDFTWDTKATRALLVGQDLSKADALVDNTQVPEVPSTKYSLKASDMNKISFSNDVKENMDGSELWQQANWKDLMFDGETSGNLIEYKWYYGTDNIAAEVKLPTDMNFEFKKSEPLTSVKVHNRTSGNGRATSIKAVGYDGATKYELGTYSTAQNVFEFAIPEEASKIDRVVITPMTSVGNATETTTGTVENRMLSLYEIEFLTDSTVHADGIAFDSTSKNSAYIGGMSEVSATVTPNKVSNPFYSITSSDESIAKVVKIPMETKYVYAIQGVKAGKVTLTATSEDGTFTDTLEFTVIDGVDVSVLEKEIQKADALAQNIYTANSWTEMFETLEKAKLIFEEPSTQGEVDAVTTELIKNVKALKFKGSNTEQPSSLDLIDRSGASLFYETSFTAVEKEHGDLVLDGNTSTFWHSNYNAGNKLPQWIVIDLGKEYNLEQVDMLPRQNSSNGHITHYRVEVSTTTKDIARSGLTIDDLEFVPVVEGYLENDGKSLESPNVPKEIKFDKTKARYVKFMAIESLGSTPNAYASIAEMNFYGIESTSFEDLSKAIEKAEVIIDSGREDTTTTSSWQKFMEAYATAVLLDESATASEIADAILGIEVATLGLESRVSDYVLESLTDLLNTAKSLEPLYTTEEFAAMKTVIGEVETLLGKDVDDISSRDATEAIAALLSAKEALNSETDVNALLENLELHLEIGNEILAEDLSNVRPAKVQSLKDAVAAGQALLDASSTDKPAIQKAIVDISIAMRELWDIVDKTELNDLVTIAEKYTAEGYTEASWTVLETALANAKTVGSNDDATTVEVADAYAALVDAISGLEKDVTLNKDALISEIALVEKMIAVIDQYVPSSVKNLPAALQSAKDALANATTQTELNEATKALTKEKLRARLRPDKTGLSALVQQAKGMDLSPYTLASANALTNAYVNAEVVLNDDEARAEDVELMVTALNKAIKNLEKGVPSTNPNEGTPSSSGSGNGVGTNDSTDINALLLLFLVAGGVLVAKKRKPFKE